MATGRELIKIIIGQLLPHFSNVGSSAIAILHGQAQSCAPLGLADPCIRVVPFVGGNLLCSQVNGKHEPQRTLSQSGEHEGHVQSSHVYTGCARWTGLVGRNHCTLIYKNCPKRRRVGARFQHPHPPQKSIDCSSHKKRCDRFRSRRVYESGDPNATCLVWRPYSIEVKRGREGSSRKLYKWETEWRNCPT